MAFASTVHCWIADKYGVESFSFLREFHGPGGSRVGSKLSWGKRWTERFIIAWYNGKSLSKAVSRWVNGNSWTPVAELLKHVSLLKFLGMIGMDILRRRTREQGENAGRLKPAFFTYQTSKFWTLDWLLSREFENSATMPDINCWYRIVTWNAVRWSLYHSYLHGSGIWT